MINEKTDRTKKKISTIDDEINILLNNLANISKEVSVVPNPEYAELNSKIDNFARQKKDLILKLSKLQTEGLALNRIIAKLPSSVHTDLTRRWHIDKVVALDNDNFDVIHHEGRQPILIKIVSKTSHGDVDRYEYADRILIDVAAGDDAPLRWNDNGAEYIEIAPKDQSNSSTPPGASSPVTEQQGIGDRVKGTKFTSKDVGGIDMNAIDLDREGNGVDIQFDPAELQEIIDAGIDGFAPVIINITPLPSVLPLLGLEPQRKEEELEVSSLN